MARQDLFNYPEEYYFPEALKSGVLTPEEMRKEYSYLRSIANKRLKALGGSEFNEHQSYLRNVGKFVPLSDIKSERELMYKLYEVKKFTSARSGSVTGLRAIQNQTLQTARERGLTFLNKNNIKAFGEFMEECRARGYARIYGSERCAELFGTAAKRRIDPQLIFEDFSAWIEGRAEEAERPRINNTKPKNSEQYRKKTKRKR